MINIPIQFAQVEESTSPDGTVGTDGIGAFNLNLKSFLFQLATFVIVLLVLRRWVFPKLVATIEARRLTLEESLTKARQTEEALARAEEKAGHIIQDARQAADSALSEANAQAREIISKAEVAANTQAQRLMAEAKDRLGQEHLKLQEQLKGELADLVIMTTEKVLREKIDEPRDRRLVEKALSEVRRG